MSKRRNDSFITRDSSINSELNVRHDDDYDEDDDVDDDELVEPERPHFPGIVRAAGVIWIAVGVIALMNAALSLAMAGANAAGGGGGGKAGSPCCGFAIAIAFLVCGYQTVTGKAKDTLGNSIGSMVFGSLQLLVALFCALVGAGAIGNQNAQALPFPKEAMIVVALVVAAMGSLLELAGIFGLMGRRSYREWRKAAFPKRRRQTRRRRDDDDEDDD